MLFPSYVATYNDISRLSLKLPTAFGGIDKQGISHNICSMPDADRAKLLSKLIAIKYYRQTALWNNVEDVGKQEKLWGEIADPVQHLLPPNTTLKDLMAFIKNDWYIVQRDFPSELSDLLTLSETEEQRIIENFSPEDCDKMCHFLTDATGNDWVDSKKKLEAQIQVQKKNQPVLDSLGIEVGRFALTQKQIDNMSAHACTALYHCMWAGYIGGDRDKITIDQILNITEVASNALSKQEIRDQIDDGRLTMEEILSLTKASLKAFSSKNVLELIESGTLTKKEVLKTTDEAADWLGNHEIYDTQYYLYVMSNGTKAQNFKPPSGFFDIW